MMPDLEVVATFMEPMPPAGFDFATISYGGWWWMGSRGWEAYEFGLDELWQVEERLTLEQKREYDDRLDALEAYAWHATAEERIKALAVILRPIVEAQ